MTCFNLPLLRGKCLIELHFKGTFALFWTRFVLFNFYQKEHILSLIRCNSRAAIWRSSSFQAPQIRHQQHEQSENNYIFKQYIYIYVYIFVCIYIYRYLYQPILVTWVLFRSRCFFVTKVSSDVSSIPYVSTFHLQGLWAAASEEAARLRHFEAGGFWKTRFNSGLNNHFIYLYERNPTNFHENPTVTQFLPHLSPAISTSDCLGFPLKVS